MNLRTLLHALRWAIMVVAALLVAGVFPFSSNGADGLTGTSGPITVTVTSDAANVATVHATAPEGVAIYSLTGHLCIPGKVTGDHAFDFSGPFCTNVPVGQSDTEKLVAFPGVAAADLQFQLGTGTANWTDDRGFPHSLTCDGVNACDLVVRIEITNSTAYFQAPYVWGVPLTAPPPAAPGTPSAADGGGGGGNGDPATVTTTTTTSTSSESASGKKDVPGGGTSSGSGSGSGGAGAAGTSHSSSRGTGENLSAAREASTVAVASDAPSRGVRVFVAALLGALCGARILAVIGRTRRRGLGAA